MAKRRATCGVGPEVVNPLSTFSVGLQDLSGLAVAAKPCAVMPLDLAAAHRGNAWE